MKKMKFYAWAILICTIFFIPFFLGLTVGQITQTFKEGQSAGYRLINRVSRKLREGFKREENEARL